MRCMTSAANTGGTCKRGDQLEALPFKGRVGWGWCGDRGGIEISGIVSLAKRYAQQLEG